MPYGLHDDLFTPLMDDHTRIRSFLGLAQRVARLEAPAEGLVAASTRRLARFFTVELGRHTSEEELLLGARLRTLPLPERVRAQVEAMEAEHRALDARVARLVERWLALGEAPARLTALAPALAEETDGLAGSLDAHLQFEERVIFPIAGTLLSAQTQNALHRELCARLGRAA